MKAHPGPTTTRAAILDARGYGVQAHFDWQPPATIASQQAHFDFYRQNTIGWNHRFTTPYGSKPLIYADWTASGRLYGPIERRMANDVGPLVGNTHTETNLTGSSMTHAYERARAIIKEHVHAGEQDNLLFAGFGMTSAISKLQRILGLKIPEQVRSLITVPEEQRPVVFVTHMEHHSNHTSWLETLAEVVVLAPGNDGLVDPNRLAEALPKFRDRPLKIGAFTACSNVTGLQTPYHELARIMHEAGGFCFVDFAASAPYVSMDMHPVDPAERLDAITFSPHKFLGGPGSSGVLVFHSDLYHLTVPDQPGGGTVRWTTPWGRHAYRAEIEEREDGGTPGFLQAIRGALAVVLKEEMGLEQIQLRERELVSRAIRGLRTVPGLSLLDGNHEDRLGILSFYFSDLHYNLVVSLLNDRFGVQVRGGCSCAGTYGHYLFGIDEVHSRRITDQIDAGNHSSKPGWVRLSLHPTMADADVDGIIDALQQIGTHGAMWAGEYRYDPQHNDFRHRTFQPTIAEDTAAWFELR